MSGVGGIPNSRVSFSLSLPSSSESEESDVFDSDCRSIDRGLPDTGLVGDWFRKGDVWREIAGLATGTVSSLGSVSAVLFGSFIITLRQRSGDRDLERERERDWERARGRGRE